MTARRGPMPAETIDLQPDSWSEPFWAAGRRDELVCARCAHCGMLRMPPGPFCPSCHSQTLAWLRLPGTGRIFTFTVVRYATGPELKKLLPYVVAVVDLDGAPGCRLVVTVLDSNGADIEIGQSVGIIWDHVTSEISVPVATVVKG
jgi:uncharacterized protein